MTATDEARRQLVRQRVHSLHIWHTAYDEEASSYCVKGRVYGTLTAVFSAIVATTFFTTLMSDDMPEWIQFSAAAIGGLAAVLATVGVSLNYPELAAEYRKRANEIGTVRARAERLLTQSVTKEALEELDAAIAAARDAPQIISDRQYHRAEERVNRIERAEKAAEAGRAVAAEHAAADASVRMAKAV